MNKFQRSYRIVIDPKDGGDAIVIGLPFTCNFFIQRNQNASYNTLSVDIYNLSKANRERIFNDKFDDRDRTITFEGGYDSLTLLFAGTIFQAGSVRQNTEIVTRIEAYAGRYDLNTTKTFQTINKGKTVGEVMEFLVGQFPSLELGAIGDYSEKLLRPVTLSGNTYDILKEYSGGNIFVDNNRIYILKDTDVIAGEIPIINDKTGILDTPIRQEGLLQVSTLFEPRVQVAQSIALDSGIAPVYNGQYKVVGIMHQGTISESVGGDCRSMFDLQTLTKIFRTRG